MAGVPGTPAAEWNIDAALVRGLLAAQYPAFAETPLREVDAGFDNVMFRLGDDLAVRLPRRELAARFAAHEHAWLPRIASEVPLPIPVPIHVGRPTVDYPWPWSIVRWLPGRPADLDPLRPDQAEPLAGFLRAVHREAPDDAPLNPYRGVPLTDREEVVRERAAGLDGTPDALPREAWDLLGAGLEAVPDLTGRWVHGDLHARNVLTSEGRLVGIVDWGDICRGDPSSDLSCIWMLLPDVASRERAMEAYGASDETWVHARGWAVAMAVLLISSGRVDHPRHLEMGRVTMRRLLEGP